MCIHCLFFMVLLIYLISNCLQTAFKVLFNRWQVFFILKKARHKLKTTNFARSEHQTETINQRKAVCSPLLKPPVPNWPWQPMIIWRHHIIEALKTTHFAEILSLTAGESCKARSLGPCYQLMLGLLLGSIECGFAIAGVQEPFEKKIAYFG